MTDTLVIPADKWNEIRKKSVVNSKGHIAIDENSFNNIIGNDMATPKKERTTKPNPKHIDEVRFTITYVLPDLNTYINAERTNKYMAAKIKKDATEAVKIACKDVVGYIDPNKRYNMVVKWLVPDNKKDSDNIFFGVKFILDGIVNAGLVSGDGRKFINNISHVIETQKGYYCAIVTLFVF